MAIALASTNGFPCRYGTADGDRPIDPGMRDRLRLGTALDEGSRSEPLEPLSGFLSIPIHNMRACARHLWPVSRPSRS